MTEEHIVIEHPEGGAESPVADVINHDRISRIEDRQQEHHDKLAQLDDRITNHSHDDQYARLDHEHPELLAPVEAAAEEANVAAEDAEAAAEEVLDEVPPDEPVEVVAEPEPEPVAEEAPAAPRRHYLRKR